MTSLSSTAKQLRFNFKISLEQDGELFDAFEILLKDTNERNRLKKIKHVLMKSLVFGITSQLSEFKLKYGAPSVTVECSSTAQPNLPSDIPHDADIATCVDQAHASDMDLMKQLNINNVSFDFSG